VAKAKSAYDSLSDESLMEAIIRKDEKAFIALYDRYSGRMVNYFYTMMRKDEEKAQDMMQDLFSKIAEKPEQFNLERNFKTWFYSIANNMCKNEYRAREVRSRVHEEIKIGSEISELSQKANELDRTLFKQKLQEALAEIDEIKRETFVLRYQEDMSIKEISEVHACSEGTVKSRLFYTLKELNTRLKVYQHLAGALITAFVLTIFR
jgi:RNA polymerase sigma-70 factor (ECF subfamily)